MNNSFVIQGDICYSKSLTQLHTIENGYLVCQNGESKGVYKELPDAYKSLPRVDHAGKLVLPGLIDLHVHAPQYSNRCLGLDMELLEWLDTFTFPEEAKFKDLAYAEKAYSLFVQDLADGPNTRASIFATVHVPATLRLMDLLEESGVCTMVGKVNMDRNCPKDLQETSAAQSEKDTVEWLKSCKGRYHNTRPILTPRFIPSCTDELMGMISELQREWELPVQSHISENKGEIQWVQELCPRSDFYGDAYDRLGLFGRGGPVIMAHYVWEIPEEIQRIRQNGVMIAHCPQSNANLSSGIAPVRRLLENQARVGLGSDVSGGCHQSIFRAMSDAVQMSKMRWRYLSPQDKPLTLEEVFYLGTLGGGAFFGKVGSFDPGFEMDLLVIDDAEFSTPFDLDISQRLARVVYLSENRHIIEKYVRGNKIKE